MKKIADYSDRLVFANVNFMDEGCPWSKFQGRYRVLYVFEDESFGDGPMVALDQEKPDDTIFVTKSSVVFEEPEVKNEMRVDYEAFIQGAHYAHEKGCLSTGNHLLIQDTIYPLKKESGYGRSYVEYGELLSALSKLDMPWYETASLWRFLGESLGEGIGVGNNF